VSTGRDDDALTWDGDDDPTLDAGAPAPALSGAARDEARPSGELPPGYTAVGRGSERPPANTAATSPAADGGATPMGNAALVGIGMVAAAFILFSLGWLIVSFRLQAVPGLPVPTIAVVAITLLAAAAPLLWFLTTYALTRRSKTWVRFTWLIAGLVLLVPWPFLVTGALG
jgi:hypothetical protein